MPTKEEDRVARSANGEGSRVAADNAGANATGNGVIPVSEDLVEPLPESERADKNAPMPGDSADIGKPSEAAEGHYGYDHTPGAVTALTPKTSKSRAKKEFLEPIVLGSTVRLGDTDRIPEKLQGAEATVLTSPIRPCNDPDCLMSPRPHYHQDESVALEVKTTNSARATLSVFREDLDLGAAGLSATGAKSSTGGSSNA